MISTSLTSGAVKKQVRHIGRNSRLLQIVVAVVVWLCIWQLVAFAVGMDLLLAGPLQTFQALLQLFVSGEVVTTVLWSFLRIACGFVLAYATALLLAYSAWRHTTLEMFLHPALLAIKSTPVVCIVVMLLIWFGAPWVSLCCVLLVVLPATYFAALEGFRALDSQRLRMLKLYRVDSLHQFGAYIWPALQSYLHASAKMTVGMSWKAGVAAELIGSPAGSIGERIYQAKIVLETADVFAWTIVIVLLAYICEQVFLYFLLHSADICSAWAIRTAAKKQQAAPISKKLVITSLSCSRGEKQLFEGFTQSFAAGSKTCLMAATGTGKTTLLHIIAGIECADRGELEHEGYVSLAYQKTCLLEQLSALDNLVLATGLPFAAIEKLLCEILPLELLSQPVCQLSGGERRCVELVRALAAPSTLVLLDEPFASLDEETHRRSAEFILRHLAGRTLIVATHDVGDATLLGASILLLDIDSDA